MIAELLSRVVSHHELMPNEPRMRPEFFVTFADEYLFLADYHSQFRTLPNVATFCGQFPEFPFERTERTAQWLLDEVEQAFIGRKVETGISDLTDLNNVNPREAARSVQALQQLLNPYISTSDAARHEYTLAFAEDAQSMRGGTRAPGITSGFPLLDEHLRGTQAGELDVWFGRTGEGKSLMLQFSTLAACRAGVTVSYVSPEMDRREVGARMFSMLLHVSASDLLSGEMNADAFDAFTDKGREFFDDIDGWGKFYFRESRGRSGRFKTSDIATMIAVDKPGIVVIDGLMFIDPVKDDRELRKRLLNTMEELKTIAVETGVPMRIAHQANRESDMSSSKSTRDVPLDAMLPNLTHLAESAAVEQYANKVIAVKRIGNRMHLAVRKNRNGKALRFISFDYDIDTGMMWDMRIDQRSDQVSRDTSPLETPGAAASIRDVPW